MKRIFFLFLLISVLTSCGTGESVPDTVSDVSVSDSIASETSAETEPEPLTKEDYPDFVMPEATDTLTVYTTEMLNVTLNPALEIFREMYPDVEVTSKVLSDDN